VVDLRADLVSQRAAFKTELPDHASRIDDQTKFQLKAMQLLPGKSNNSSDQSLQLADLPQFPNANSHVDRKKQTLLTSQSPGENKSELLLAYQYQYWTHKE
jgi:hypothetical protein